MAQLDTKQAIYIRVIHITIKCPWITTIHYDGCKRCLEVILLIFLLPTAEIIQI